MFPDCRVGFSTTPAPLAGPAGPWLGRRTDRRRATPTGHLPPGVRTAPPASGALLHSVAAPLPPLDDAAHNASVPMSYQIFVVDDHPVMRRGYAYLVDNELDLEVCGEADSAREALAQIPETDPDLALVDLTLKGMGGLELIKRLQAQHPDVLILVVSMHDETLYADRALRAGARGYIMKSEVESVIIDAIRQVLEGKVYVSETLGTQILLRYTGAAPGEGTSPLERLSDRELEVFEAIGRGFGTREIAEKLALSPKTIDSYRSRIKDKLAIESNSILTRRAVLWVENQGGRSQ